MNRLAVHSSFFLGEQTIVPKVEHITNRGEIEGPARAARIGLMIKEWVEDLRAVSFGVHMLVS